MSVDVNSLIYEGSIPAAITHNDVTYYKIIQRGSYFDHLATQILRNNTVSYSVMYEHKVLPLDFPVGVAYDLSGVRELPWKIEIHVKDPSQTRESSRDLLLGALRHAEYVTRGYVKDTIRFTKDQLRDLDHQVTSGNGVYKEERSTAMDSLENVAVRFHFGNGLSKVQSLTPDDTVFGIVQGILLSPSKAKYITSLKHSDNWLHVVLPNAKTPMERDSPVCIKLVSVGSTPILKNDILRVSKTKTCGSCMEYIAKKLQFRGRIYMYVDGIVPMLPSDTIGNYVINKDKITVYYSIEKAWL